MSSAALVSSPSALPLPSALLASLPASPLEDSNDKENVPAAANMTTESKPETELFASSAAASGDSNKQPSDAHSRHGQQAAADNGKEERSHPADTAANAANGATKADKDEDAAITAAAAVPDTLDASYMDEMDTAALLSHGQSLLSNRQWNLACEALSRCVERAAAEYGDTALALAPLYALYGRALMEHWTSAQDALGDKIREAQAERKINEGAGGLIGDDDVDEDGQAQGELDAGADDSMAWEALDLARAIYQRHYDAMASSDAAPPTATTSSASAPSTAYLLPVPTSRHEMGLALVSLLLRLGDLHQEQEKFVEAATDYNQALSLQRTLLPMHSRDRAATHMELAVCSLWQQQPALALHHYTEAYNTLHHCLLWLMAGKPTPAQQQQRLSDDLGEEKRLLESKMRVVDSEWKGASEEERKEAAEYRDLIAELKERMDEMRAEISKQAMPASAASLSSSIPSSSSSSSSLSSSSSGFFSSPFSIPSLSFSLSSSSSSLSPPIHVPSSEPAGVKRKTDENAVIANGQEKETAEAFNVPVVKRKKV